MKNIFKKNQIIITTLAIMIAVVGYLNYSGTQIKDANNAKEANADANVTVNDVDTSDISEEDIYAQTQNTITQSAAETGTELEAADTSVAEIPSQDLDLTSADAGNTSGSESNPGEAVMTSSANVGAIEQARLTREQTRAKNKETLLDLINNTNISDSQKQNAIQDMINLTDICEKEAAAEILLEAKGFQDVVVSIQNDSVDVVVNKSNLDDTQRAQIEDIVKRKTGISGEKIVITPVTVK